MITKLIQELTGFLVRRSHQEDQMHLYPNIEDSIIYNNNKERIITLSGESVLSLALRFQYMLYKEEKDDVRSWTTDQVSFTDWPNPRRYDKEGRP